MKRFWIMTALCGLALPTMTRAQEESAAPLAPVAPPLDAGAAGATAPSCGPYKLVACPAVENKKHTRYCYDCKEEDYCYTKWAHIPILTYFCHDHCGTCGCADDGEPCHKCGHPRTRKVLIKCFVTEEVPTPKCNVTRQPVCCEGCGPAVSPEAAAAWGQAPCSAK